MKALARFFCSTLVVAALGLPAGAQLNDPYNNYWSVADSGPGTQVWSGLRGQFVALADATYVAWLAAGNTVASMDTSAHMQATIKSLQATLQAAPPVSITVGAATQVPLSITENATLPGYITALTVGAGGSVALPPANLSISPTPGRPFYIQNNDVTNTLTVFLNDGVTAVASIPVQSRAIVIIPQGFSGLADANGSWTTLAAVPSGEPNNTLIGNNAGSTGQPLFLTKSQAQVVLGYPVVLGGFLAGVNLNNAGSDNGITISSPTTNYSIDRVQVFNTGTTASLTTATAGLFTATGGAGLALAATQALSPITSNAVGTDANMMDLVTTIGSRAVLNQATLQFRNVAAQGASAAASVYIWIRPKP